MSTTPKCPVINVTTAGVLEIHSTEREPYRFKPRDVSYVAAKIRGACADAYHAGRYDMEQETAKKLARFVDIYDDNDYDDSGAFLAGIISALRELAVVNP